MKVTIELFGASRDFSNQDSIEINIENNSTIKDVRDKMLDYLNSNFKGNENFIKIVNSSATAWVIGKTVEEPSINISPVSVSTAGSETSFVDSTVAASELVSLLSPHATSSKDRININEVNLNLVIKFPF